MQATSTVPLWQLYHKQECVLDPTTSFEFERDLLVRITPFSRGSMSVSQHRVLMPAQPCRSLQSTAIEKMIDDVASHIDEVKGSGPLAGHIGLER